MNQHVNSAFKKRAALRYYFDFNLNGDKTLHQMVFNQLSGFYHSLLNRGGIHLKMV